MLLRMWKASYGTEPFDLRLTVLRLIRNFYKIIALTAAGTLLFGGIYYVKKVLCGPAPQYAAVSTYKVQYVVEPAQSGDYYINEATWESLVHTQEFLNGVQTHLAEAAAAFKLSAEELGAMISAKLPSDWHVPTTTVVCDDPVTCKLVAWAVEQTMEKEFLTMMGEEVASVKVLDSAENIKEVLPDVRPFRAFVLSAVLSFFFVLVAFLLKETGDDSIWLPAAIRRRYGLPVVGTVHSIEFAENMKYLFRDKKRIAVCTVDERIDPAEAAAELASKWKQAEIAQNAAKRNSEESAVMAESELIPVPTPLLAPQVCETLRQMEGILLVVKAGAHAGKTLEYVKEMLQQQDCEITAVVLWEADETLLRAYYFGKRNLYEGTGAGVCHESNVG